MNRASLIRVLCIFCVLSTQFGANAIAAELQIVQIVPLSGPLAVEGREANIGVQIAIKAANANGGIGGHKFSLRVIDDEYKPEKTVELIKAAGRTNAIAMILPVGSPSLTKVLKDRVLDEAKIPIVGVIPGAEPLREHHPLIFHVRAGDEDQFRKIVEHTITIGQKSIGIVYAENPHGKAGREKIRSILRERQLAPTIEIPIPLFDAPNYPDVFARIKNASPDVLIIVSPGQRAAEFVAAHRNAKLTSQIVTMSYGTAEVICRVAGDDAAHGVGIAQVVPNFKTQKIAISRQFQEDAKAYGDARFPTNQSQFEAYITARVLIEGVKRAGSAATSREGFVRGLEGMRDIDLGGFNVSFSTQNHIGSKFVDISIVGKKCQLLF